MLRTPAPLIGALAVMILPTELYETQQRDWPHEGRHILAHYDDSSIIVYQAYRPSIGKFAIENGRLGGPEFSFSRMSWIKPNFLWMMYRSGWGTKEGQEVTLALRIRRTFFDHIIAQAVPSSYQPDYPGGREAWSVAVGKSDVRLQWDPDHSPSGAKQERRAIQLGLRGQVLEAFAGPELIEVIDLSDFVATQRPCAAETTNTTLRTPVGPWRGSRASHQASVETRVRHSFAGTLGSLHALRRKTRRARPVRKRGQRRVVLQARLVLARKRFRP